MDGQEKDDVIDLEETVDTDTDVDELEDDAETSVKEEDDEFEYDEDGNIIIPDVIEEDEEEDVEVDTEQDDNAEEEDSAESGDSDEPSDTSKVAESEQDNKDARISELEKELEAFKKQTKETLNKLGVTVENEYEGLEALAAEADDITIEEYRKRKTDASQIENAKKAQQNAEFEKKAAADLLELQKYYPETKGLKTIYEMENLSEFGHFRDLGLSPKQAYAAANPDSIKTHTAEAVRQQSLNSTKKHLVSSVPKGSKDNSITMTKKELATWKDIFPHLSDKEIVSLYKKTKNG